MFLADHVTYWGDARGKKSVRMYRMHHQLVIKSVLKTEQLMHEAKVIYKK